MNPNEIQDLVELLIEIGGSLAEAGFEIAMRRTIFVGYSNLVLVIVSIIAGSILLRQASKSKKIWEEDKYSDHEVVFWITAFSSTVCFFFVPFMIYEFLDYLLNPEWHAVQMLLELIP